MADHLHKGYHAEQTPKHLSSFNLALYPQPPFPNSHLLFPHSLRPLLILTRHVTTIVNFDLGTSSRKLINIPLVEPPCRHLFLEQHIQLSKRPVPSLRQHEEHEDDEQNGKPGVEEASHAGPVPLVGRKHAWDDDVVEDASLYRCQS
jgi:hypothetical protein